AGRVRLLTSTRPRADAPVTTARDLDVHATPVPPHRPGRPRRRNLPRGCDRPGARREPARSRARDPLAALHLSAVLGPVGTGHGLRVRAVPPAARALRPGGSAAAGRAHAGSAVPRERGGLPLRGGADAQALRGRAGAVVRRAPRPGERRAVPALDALA